MCRAAGSELPIRAAEAAQLTGATVSLLSRDVLAAAAAGPALSVPRPFPAAPCQDVLILAGMAAAAAAAAVAWQQRRPR